MVLYLLVWPLIIILCTFHNFLNLKHFSVAYKKWMSANSQGLVSVRAQAGREKALYAGTVTCLVTSLSYTEE